MLKDLEPEGLPRTAITKDEEVDAKEVTEQEVQEEDVQNQELPDEKEDIVDDLPPSAIPLDEGDEVQIPFPKQSSATLTEDVELELPPIVPSSPSQPSAVQYSGRSRKSSSSASILSIRARSGADTMFKPGTPTTAVSAVIAQSAAGTRDSPGTTPGSPLTRTNGSEVEDGYFAEHRRRTSVGSVGIVDRHEERDEAEVKSDKEALLVRPAYGTASQSLREIHLAK